MRKPKYKIGDKVFVVKPENTEEYPTFIQEMDEALGLVLPITHRPSYENKTYIYFLDVRYVLGTNRPLKFREEWLRPATTASKLLYMNKGYRHEKNSYN